jgi:hypothetical protein
VSFSITVLISEKRLQNNISKLKFSITAQIPDNKLEDVISNVYA